MSEGLSALIFVVFVLSVGVATGSIAWAIAACTGSIVFANIVK